MSRTCFRLIRGVGLYGVALLLIGSPGQAGGQETPMTRVGQAGISAIDVGQYSDVRLHYRRWLDELVRSSTPTRLSRSRR